VESACHEELPADGQDKWETGTEGTEEEEKEEEVEEEEEEEETDAGKMPATRKGETPSPREATPSPLAAG
jgi:hypothetical protein